MDVISIIKTKNLNDLMRRAGEANRVHKIIANHRCYRGIRRGLTTLSNARPII
jgi:hypothetical protein